jgi:hypothetical protein
MKAILHRQKNSSDIINYALPRRYLRDGKWGWRDMGLSFKDFVHPLSTWSSTASIHVLYLLRLIAFQYYLNNLIVTVEISNKSLIMNCYNKKSVSSYGMETEKVN